MNKNRIAIVGLMAAALALASRTATAQKCVVFNISLQGQIGDSYGATPFRRSGVLTLYGGELGGSGNPSELWLQSGNPVTAPQVGSIFVASNTGLIGSIGSTLRNGQLKLASIGVQKTNNGVIISTEILNQFAITQGGMFNIVNLSSGVTADPKLVDSGTIKFSLDQNSGEVAGEILLRVRNWLTTPHQASIVYQATFHGMLAGETSSCSASSR